MLDILVACEESQAVVTELRVSGHNAYSCDILPCSGNHKEWHICQDVLPLLNGNCSFETMDGKIHAIADKWDLIIAFPPCTHLAVSGAPYFEKKRADGRQEFGIEFFCKFFDADCEHIMIENPVNIISGDYVKQWFPELAEKYSLPKKPTQKIQPWNFGDNFSKTTCLWLKGLKPLVLENTIEPVMEYKTWVDKKTGKTKRENLWLYNCFAKCKTPLERQMMRSKTFPGIAHAIATQFAEQIEKR